MYNNKRRFHSNRSRSNFRRPVRRIKKLDQNLFIRKSDHQVALLPDQPLVESAKKSFNEFAISEKLRENIANHGYTTPTEIQQRAIPEILSGRDIIGMANTGTGKTGAFLISLINKSYTDKNQRVLIVAPTRELAVQIKDEYNIFARGTGLQAVAIVGGVNIRQQFYALRNNPHFIIGTPGRLKDLVNRRQLNLGQFQNVVLDEVDKMVDIGFIHDIKFLISHLPVERQSLFFSATVSGKTREILHSFVKDPVYIAIKQQVKVNNIDQDIVKISNGQSKVDTLHDLLIKPGFDKVIIFGRTKWGIQKLTDELIDRGFRAAAIHGNKSQAQRQKALNKFKNNEVQLLLATDVVARGVDIDSVTHVINYDQPESYDDYIHRIGRTGRAGKKGTALTFVD